MTDKTTIPQSFTTKGSSLRWPAARPDRPAVYYDNDREFHELYDEALAATQMDERTIRRQRHYLIPQVLKRVAHLPGVPAEVGCYRGLSAFVICRTLQTLGRTDTFHIFDSFEGLSKATGRDESAYLPAQLKNAANLFACAEDRVRTNLSPFPFVEFHKGWVPDCFADESETRFFFVHVDVDHYEATKDAIAFFWPRISLGGAMVLDDYGTLYFPGARAAADEFFSKCLDAFIVETPAGSAVAIKINRLPNDRTERTTA